MKKWMVSFFVLALLLASNARAQTTDVKDGYWLHEGRIMLLRNGELLPLTEQVALPNGLTLLPNGELVTRQGVRRNLQQGQAIDASGRILFPQTQPNGTARHVTAKPAGRPPGPRAITRAVIIVCPALPSDPSPGASGPSPGQNSLPEQAGAGRTAKDLCA
jgi:hypothetical protein